MESLNPLWQPVVSSTQTGVVTRSPALASNSGTVIYAVPACSTISTGYQHLNPAFTASAPKALEDWEITEQDKVENLVTNVLDAPYLWHRRDRIFFLTQCLYPRLDKVEAELLSSSVCEALEALPEQEKIRRTCLQAQEFSRACRDYESRLKRDERVEHLVNMAGRYIASELGDAHFEILKALVKDLYGKEVNEHEQVRLIHLVLARMSASSFESNDDDRIKRMAMMFRKMFARPVSNDDVQTIKLLVESYYRKLPEDDVKRLVSLTFAALRYEDRK
ncbi:hypothetical protein [Endozoicomonas arenosclerae]|uniref:hypothetical protein n=1 Tax=Endozoicomonas arenosclerae TaxID=1633495 RepID=UPI00155F86C8|nr:hypothetical protein [Endozoicomonas arenosclerae]